jgi:hypothetical protein
MATNCSLVIPNEFTVTAAGCLEPNDNVCNNNGIVKKIFRVNLPSATKTGIVTVHLINGHNLSKTSKSVVVPDAECSCTSSCDNKFGYISHIIEIEFNDLIVGDKYNGTACFDYIA